MFIYFSIKFHGHLIISKHKNKSAEDEIRTRARPKPDRLTDRPFWCSFLLKKVLPGLRVTVEPSLVKLSCQERLVHSATSAQENQGITCIKKIVQ
jgi:hypothetical protein